MTIEKQAKHFAQFLRRTLILMRLMKYNMDHIRHESYLPGEYKQRCAGFVNSINMFLGFQKSKAKTATWNEINADLEHDRLHDISLLIDEVADIKDITPIIEAIREGKKNYIVEKNKDAA